MDSTPPASAWNDGLTRRLRSLLRTGPLHALRQSRPDALLPHDDPAALCMKALEVLIDALGVRPGATRVELEEALAPLLAANDRAHQVEPSPERHAQVVGRIIGTLLNDGGRRQAYAVDYVDFEDGCPLRRTLRFRLASEQEALSGAIVIRAEADGINLFLRCLDVDLEDAQAATEAVIQSQLARGRLDLAVQSAREAQIRSHQYEQQLRFAINQTRRDLGRVDWRHAVPRLLEEAAAHLESRIGSERQLLATVEGHVDALAGKPEVAQLVRIRDLLSDCRERHQALLAPLFDARTVFLAEQARQRFAPIPVAAVPALHADLYEPLLALPAQVAGQVGLTFEQALLPPHAPVLLDLQRLWERLLQPPRHTSPTGPAIDDPLTPVEEPPATFPPELVARVDGHLRELQARTTLSEILQAFTDPREARFACLRIQQHFAPAAEPALPLTVEIAGQPLTDSRFEGDDLAVEPAMSVQKEIVDAA